MMGREKIVELLKRTFNEIIEDECLIECIYNLNYKVAEANLLDDMREVASILAYKTIGGHTHYGSSEVFKVMLEIMEGVFRDEANKFKGEERPSKKKKMGGGWK